MRISDWSSDVCSSDLERVVLLLDFNRPMRLGGRLVTWLFFQIMKLTAFYQEPKRNIRDFESRLEGAAKRANENLERNASAPAPDRQTGSCESFLDRKSTRLNSSH